MGKVSKSDKAWQDQLTESEYLVTRKKATEPPFSGKYCDFKAPGTYNCTCCGQPLFDAQAKFDSGSGWPSFTAPISASEISSETDTSHGMVRTEVLCSQCDAHLGHVFPDGPGDTGLRYCINSLALKHSGEKD